jgi:hypothetical protein
MIPSLGQGEITHDLWELTHIQADWHIMNPRHKSFIMPLFEYCLFHYDTARGHKGVETPAEGIAVQIEGEFVIESRLKMFVSILSFVLQRCGYDLPIISTLPTRRVKELVFLLTSAAIALNDRREFDVIELRENLPRLESFPCTRLGFGEEGRRLISE